MTAPTERQAMAQALAARGLHVFRVRLGDKRPVAQGWQAEATTDPAIVAKLFAADDNIGIRTGERSRCFVLDIDGEEGETSLFALEERHEPLPTTLAVETPNGVHYYFRWRPGLRNSAGQVGPGVDIRAEGGFVVGPGSLHPSGGIYRLVDDAPIAGAPGWLLSAIDVAKPAKNGRSAEYWRDHVAATFSEGQRNQRVAQITGHLLRRHVDPHVVRELLIGWNATHCEPPLPLDELGRTFESICARELRRRQRAFP